MKKSDLGTITFLLFMTTWAVWILVIHQVFGVGS